MQTTAQGRGSRSSRDSKFRAQLEAINGNWKPESGHLPHTEKKQVSYKNVRDKKSLKKKTSRFFQNSFFIGFLPRILSKNNRKKKQTKLKLWLPPHLGFLQGRIFLSQLPGLAVFEKNPGDWVLVKWDFIRRYRYHLISPKFIRRWSKGSNFLPNFFGVI